MIVILRIWSSRAKVNNDLLDSSLNDEKPVILGEQGHFVVAKGKTADSYLINDPGHSDRPTLESYGNSYLSQGIYTPSNTDLSYIMLVVDEDVDIELTDENGDIVGDWYLEEITDLNDPNLSNESLKTYMFAKPSDGDYFVTLSGGDGTYSLDAYIYDEDGNVISESINGTTSEEEQIKITIGEEGG